MATPQDPVPASTPLYILTWRLPARGRGRKHMALFIPAGASTAIHLDAVEHGDPTGRQSCRGLLLQAVGSPFTGYQHDFVRTFDVRSDRAIESAVHVGGLSATEGGADEGGDVWGKLESHASRVRAPGVAKRPWVAEDILNCQDWLVDLTTYLVQRRVVGEAVLDAVKALVEAPVAVMPASGGGGRITASSVMERPVTASLGPGASVAELTTSTAGDSKIEGEDGGDEVVSGEEEKEGGGGGGKE